MKQFFTLFLIFFSITATSEEPSLQESMQVIGRNFAVIAQALFQENKIEESHLENITAIQTASTKGASQYPETANTDELKAEYSQMMNSLTQEALKMEEEMRKVLESSEEEQDLSICKQIYLRMSDLEREGHIKFR